MLARGVFNRRAPWTRLFKILELNKALTGFRHHGWPAGAAQHARR
jgi:hypothetical protein